MESYESHKFLKSTKVGVYVVIVPLLILSTPCTGMYGRFKTSYFTLYNFTLQLLQTQTFILNTFVLFLFRGTNMPARTRITFIYTTQGSSLRLVISIMHCPLSPCRRGRLPPVSQKTWQTATCLPADGADCHLSPCRQGRLPPVSLQMGQTATCLPADGADCHLSPSRRGRLPPVSLQTGQTATCLLADWADCHLSPCRRGGHKIDVCWLLLLQ